MAKSEKSKLPKKVAGLKVPKALRKSKALETLVGSEAGRRILAEAIMAAATAAASALTADRSGKAGAGQKRASGSLVTEATSAAAGAVADIVTQTVQDLVTGRSSEERKSDRKPKAASRKRGPAPAPATAAQDGNAGERAG